MKLSIVIPVYNEEKTIEKVLEELALVKFTGIAKEIIVVDDCSSDKTFQIVSEYKGKKIKFIRHISNMGKGSAVRTGFGMATGDYVLIQDADLEYHPSDIVKLLQPLKENNNTVAYGTRLKRLPNLSRDERTLRFFIHYVGNKFLSLLTSILYGVWITDMETGYKLFPFSAIKKIQIKARSFDFEPEITAKLLKNKYKIIEVPISTNPRGYEEGKKLNTIRDGLIALWVLIKYRFVD